MNKTVPEQMLLDLQHLRVNSKEDFIIGSCNQLAFETITAWPNWPAERLILIGPPGSGKSHLGAIYASQSDALCFDSAQIPPPNVIDTLNLKAVLIENGHIPERDETNLFHLLNHCHEIKACVLITARTKPEAWLLRLNDLKSRIRSSYPLNILEPDDAFLEKALFKFFSDRQLNVDKRVIDYLLVRMERSLSSAFELVNQLDQLSLETGRSITRQLAAQLL